MAVAVNGERDTDESTPSLDTRFNRDRLLFWRQRATELSEPHGARRHLSPGGRRAVYAGMQMPLSDAVKYEAFIVSTIYQTSDRQEGIRSFLEKRSPRFTGA